MTSPPASDRLSPSIIYQPRVYLLAKSLLREEALERFLREEGIDWQTDAPGPAEKLVEVAGRVCYLSFTRPRPGGNKAYIQHLLESGHGSVLEHAVFTFLLTGISRSCSHELVRHRAGFSYSQLSQRYVDESQAKFVQPPLLEQYPALAAQWHLAMQRSQEAYRQLVEGLAAAKGLSGKLTTEERKKLREAARSVLPNATETKLVVTANARAWRHFIEMRASRYAEAEIRRLAVAILKILQQEAPNLFGDYQLVPLEDGSFEAQTQWRKV